MSEKNSFDLFNKAHCDQTIPAADIEYLHFKKLAMWHKANLFSFHKDVNIFNNFEVI